MDILGQSWRRHGASWEGLGGPWRRPGRVFGPSEGILGRLGPSSGRLGGVVARFEKHLKTSGFIVFSGTQAQKKTSKGRLEDVLWASRGLLGGILGLLGAAFCDSYP